MGADYRPERRARWRGRVFRGLALAAGFWLVSGLSHAQAPAPPIAETATETATTAPTEAPVQAPLRLLDLWLLIAVLIETAVAVTGGRAAQNLRVVASGVNDYRLEQQSSRPGRGGERPVPDADEEADAETELGSADDAEVEDIYSLDLTPSSSAAFGASPHWQAGHELAAARHQVFADAAQRPDGLVLLTDALQPLSVNEAESAGNAPNLIVLASLACTIAGLMIAVHSLSGVLRNASDPSAAAPYFQGLWMAFLPALVGLVLSLALSGATSHALRVWTVARDELDKWLVDVVLHADELQHGDIDRAAAELTKVARGLGSAAGVLNQAVVPFGKSVGQLEATVGKLDTANVQKTMTTAAKEFGERLHAGGASVERACQALNGATAKLTPQAQLIVESSGHVEHASGVLKETADGIQRAFVDLRNNTDDLAKALQPAAESLQTGLDGLGSAQRQLSETAASLKTETTSLSQSVRDQLTPAVQKLSTIHEPVSKSLTEATGQLTNAATWFQQVAQQQQANQTATTAGLKDMVETLQTTAQHMQTMTSDWHKVVREGLAGQQSFSDRTIEALRAELAATPPLFGQVQEAVTQVTAAAERLGEQAAGTSADLPKLQQLIRQIGQTLVEVTNQASEQMKQAAGRVEAIDFGALSSQVEALVKAAGHMRQTLAEATANSKTNEAAKLMSDAAERMEQTAAKDTPGLRWARPLTAGLLAGALAAGLILYSTNRMIANQTQQSALMIEAYRTAQQSLQQQMADDQKKVSTRLDQVDARVKAVAAKLPSK